MKSASVIALVSAVVLACDLISKQWALSNLQAGTLAPFIPHVLGLTLVTNSGTAFGMWRGMRLVGLLLPPLVCAAIIWWIYRRETTGRPLAGIEQIAFGLVLGGAGGNVIDRLLRGEVTDFIYFAFWTSFPVFNVADALIDVGMGLLIIHSLFTAEPKESTASDG
jgi:signal peptidase II